LPPIDPSLVALLTDAGRGLRELRIPFAIVGALVPQLLLQVSPRRLTLDADVTVVVPSMAGFDELKSKLVGYGFVGTSTPHLLRHRGGGRMDLLPFSEAIAPDGSLELAREHVLNMAGFGHVVPNAIEVLIEGVTLPVAPLPLYALLKLVAFSDRRERKDLASVLHCLEHYHEDDDRRFSAEHDREAVLWEYAGAYLLGLDGRRFLDGPVRLAVAPILDGLDDRDGSLVSMAAREHCGIPVEDEDRTEVFQLFRWYRLGTER
jgi:predicted nucleotidyltransferase